MLGVAAGIYFGEHVHSNIASGMLMALGMGATGLGIPTFFSLLQGLVPSKAVSLAHGGMNGIGTGISSLSPVIIGFFMSVTGSYSGGLFFVVGVALVGAAAAFVLALQKY
jgi:cyanate permease